MAEDAPLDLILGSASPRRADLLAGAGYNFRIRVVEIDETATRADVEDGDIVSATTVIARAKFDALVGVVGGTRSAPVLTADTLVACNGVTMGKPHSAAGVASMLSDMSGQRLSITTAVCLGLPTEEPRAAAVTTMVQLTTLTATEVDRYVETNVGLDKAAGLALQSEARPFIAALDRCWSNVLGLPLCAVRSLMQGHGAEPSLLCTTSYCGSHMV